MYVYNIFVTIKRSTRKICYLCMCPILCYTYTYTCAYRYTYMYTYMNGFSIILPQIIATCTESDSISVDTFIYHLLF